MVQLSQHAWPLVSHQGDFNHDGNVDILDYQQMAPNYDTKLAASTLAGAGTVTNATAGIVAATVTAQATGSAAVVAAAAAVVPTTATPVSKRSVAPVAAAVIKPVATVATIADSASGADELYLGVSYQPVFAD